MSTGRGNESFLHLNPLTSKRYRDIKTYYYIVIKMHYNKDKDINSYISKMYKLDTCATSKKVLRARLAHLEEVYIAI